MKNKLNKLNKTTFISLAAFFVMIYFSLDMLGGKGMT
jgi:hypothetical protein